MAGSRFGGASPAQSYATKVRWLVGCLVSVILVLAVAIVFIAQNTDAREPTGGVVPEASFDPIVAPTVRVIVATTRVERGERFTAQMFTTQEMDADKTPLAVIQAQDRDSIVGKFAKRLINANTPLVIDDVSDVPPFSTIEIPPGYRAVTLNIDRTTGVDGWAQPNSRVDVLLRFNQDGRNKVVTLTRFVKILSVGNLASAQSSRTQISGSTPVTLLVTERDAKRIELAKTLGTLSLTLIGDRGTPGAANPAEEEVTLDDIIPRAVASDEPEEVANDGVMYTSDARTGRQLRYVLRNGRWSLDRAFEEAE